MATENQPGDPATDSTETVDQEATGKSTGETPQDKTESQTQPEEGAEVTEDNQKDPAKQALLADLHKERDSRKALQAQVEKLTADLDTATKATDQLTAVQRKYDRLEEFLSKMGGPLGKALDSKSFTAKLFDSDDDIEDLVKSWHKDNPSATTVALSSEGAATDKKPSMNDLLRSAVK